MTGLTRVRKFHQDDGHIFCRADQIEGEISKTLEFLQRIYSILGFKEIQTCLSTRPEKYIGNVQEWVNAENALVAALNKRKVDFILNEGDGAFYGPKIDILIKDTFGRNHQTATIQLDFQLPERFSLTYLTEKDNLVRPVIIHRAVLGSVERMMAILIEHYRGKWPFWISPRQAIVISVAKPLNDYAIEVARFLSTNGAFSGNIIEGLRNRSAAEYFYVDSDTSDKTLGKKIHDAQINSYNYIIVVGEKELKSQSITIRERGLQQKGKSLSQTISLEEALSFFHEKSNKKL